MASGPRDAFAVHGLHSQMSSSVTGDRQRANVHRLGPRALVFTLPSSTVAPNAKLQQLTPFGSDHTPRVDGMSRIGEACRACKSPPNVRKARHRSPVLARAADGPRTRDLKLGKLALYQ